MKKEYKTPAMKVVAVRTERLMNNGSDININEGPAYPGQKAWSKEECEDGDFGW